MRLRFGQQCVAEPCECCAARTGSGRDFVPVVAPHPTLPTVSTILALLPHIPVYLPLVGIQANQICIVGACCCCSWLPIPCRLDERILMSRCGHCNAAAFRRISHEEAAVHVNAKLLELVEEFWQCGK